VTTTTTTTTILRPLYRSTCVSWHLQLRTEGFVGAKFYCLHALADGNQRIRMSENDTVLLYTKMAAANMTS